MKYKILSVILAVSVVFLALCGCTAPKVKNDKFTVICSIFVVYDFVRQVAGDKAETVMLLPPGVESHSYEPTPSDIIKLENADMLFYVSEHTETWMRGILSVLENDSVRVVEMAESLGIEVHDHHHEHDGEHEAHEHEEHEIDEHIWTDLDIAAAMVKLTVDEMSKADPDNAEYYKTNGESYAEKINALRDDFKVLVNSSKRRDIVSGSRFAMKNFTEEFGIDFTAAFDSCVDNTEPSAGVMAKIIDKIKDDNIPVIFYEELTEPKIAGAVSAETGAKMRLLHSCHNISASELKSGATYLSLMKQNYINIKEALN